MESVMQSDIFFFITSIAVVAVAIAVVLVLIQLFRLVRSMRRISQQVEDDVTSVRSAIGDIRTHLASIPGLGFLFRTKTARSRSRRKRSSAE